MIQFHEITSQNVWKIATLSVFEEQKDFVATNFESLAEAYAYRNEGSFAWPLAIYDNETPVGFLMFGYGNSDPEDPPIAKGNYCLVRLMLDKTQQGKGYFTPIMNEIIQTLRAEPAGKADFLWLSYEKENTHAAALYHRAGFTENGELCGDEIVAVRPLNAALCEDVADLSDGEICLRLTNSTPAVPEKGFFPAYKFNICLADGTPVGRCDLRFGHNVKTYIGGNIGYSVDEAYRGHHYAAKACRLLFGLAKRHGFDHLFITCDPENVPSYKTCEAAGGNLLEIADVPEEDDMYERGMRKVCVFRFEL